MSNALPLTIDFRGRFRTIVISSEPSLPALASSAKPVKIFERHNLEHFQGEPSFAVCCGVGVLIRGGKLVVLVLELIVALIAMPRMYNVVAFVTFIIVIVSYFAVPPPTNTSSHEFLFCLIMRFPQSNSDADQNGLPSR